MHLAPSIETSHESNINVVAPYVSSTAVHSFNSSNSNSCLQHVTSSSIILFPSIRHLIPVVIMVLLGCTPKWRTPLDEDTSSTPSASTTQPRRAVTLARWQILRPSSAWFISRTRRKQLTFAVVVVLRNYCGLDTFFLSMLWHSELTIYNPGISPCRVVCWRSFWRSEFLQVAICFNHLVWLMLFEQPWMQGAVNESSDVGLWRMTNWREK